MLLELVKFAGKVFLMQKKIEILSLAKNRKKFKVTTSEGEYTFCEDTILKHYVFKGKIFNEEEFAEILNSELDNTLFNKALNYLSYQIRSTKEVSQYLQKHQATISQSESIMARLADLGYLNDFSFAVNMQDSVCLRKKGPQVLKLKLKEKGISEDIIVKVLDSYSREMQEEIVAGIIANLVKRNNHLPARKQKQNLYDKLQRDGFNRDVINEQLSQVEFTDDSDQTLSKEIVRLQIKYRDNDPKVIDMKIIANLMNKGYEYSDIARNIKKTST